MMEIAKSAQASTTWSLEGILARREMPLDRRRSEGAPALPSDTFRPSLRTPLDADRILASRAESAPPLLGMAEDAGEDGAKMRDSPAKEGTEGSRPEDAVEAQEPSSEDAKGGKGPEGGLTEEEKAQVAELKRRDTEVRAHEQAHLAASGGMARGGASFSFQKGPDGRSYAVGGEVQIAMKGGRTPEETIRNAEQVRAAALAPADPSGVDQQTAAAATRMAQEARQELSAMARQTTSNGGRAEGEPRRGEDAPERSAQAGSKPDAMDAKGDSTKGSDSVAEPNTSASAPAVAAPKSYSLASERRKDETLGG